jgi:hypothetical protein
VILKSIATKDRLQQTLGTKVEQDESGWDGMKRETNFNLLSLFDPVSS